MTSESEDLQRGFAAVPGGRIAYEGSLHGGTPVLLLRPLGGSMAMWGSFRARLAETRRVLAFDHRGAGASSPAPAPPGPAAKHAPANTAAAEPAPETRPAPVEPAEPAGAARALGQSKPSTPRPSTLTLAEVERGVKREAAALRACSGDDFISLGVRVVKGRATLESLDGDPPVLPRDSCAADFVSKLASPRAVSRSRPWSASNSPSRCRGARAGSACLSARAHFDADAERPALDLEPSLCRALGPLTPPLSRRARPPPMSTPVDETIWWRARRLAASPQPAAGRGPPTAPEFVTRWPPGCCCCHS